MKEQVSKERYLSIKKYKCKNGGMNHDYKFESCEEYKSFKYPMIMDTYRCKNAPFETLRELLLVKGMTETIFYGETGDETQNIEAVE